MPRGAIYTPDPLEKHPLNEGLVAAWLPIPGLTGGRSLYDLARFNHGTLTNGPTWVAAQGELGALQFDGSNDYVDAPAVISAYPFTVSCLIRSDGAGSGTFRTFYSQGVTSGGSGSDYLVLQLGSGSFGTNNNCVSYNVAYNGGSNQAILHDSLSLADSQWHLVTAVSASNSDHKVYIDGVLRVSSSASSTLPGFTQTCIGALSYPGTTQFFPGSVQATWIHSRALSVPEIGDLYDQSIHDHPDLLRRVPTSRTVVMTSPPPPPPTVFLPAFAA